ncbi:response regulator [Alkalihalobacterium alkalinitrilicum]|uniref:response regulator n=1 Tax=Alkalihalobacterium alkalinitrilicum TaxID=427920 RepID=UPI00099570C9|nr:response regulator [Alkalihalobacterium alkalinitrilicum]
MREIFEVLIVEDDFRVADITRQYVNKVDGFVVQTIVKTGEETLDYLKNRHHLPDLIFLDVYIPDVVGLNLFWEIRKRFRLVDIIMVTAAKEVSTVEEALRGGIFDYIVKPVEFERFEQTLKRYREHRQFLKSKEEVEQEDIDQLTGSIHTSFSSKSTGIMELPKGIDAITLDKIKNIMKQNQATGLTAVELGHQIGASRSTARRYLEFLVSVKEVEAKLKYGDVGRPERRYLLT